ncbi:MAG: ATP-dependent RecD-like DNA helicase, partial [Bacilli bacterium]
MELTKKQQQGLQIAIDRYLNNKKYTIISGYAGTGKSTLVKFIIAALAQYGIDPDTEVIFTSFTGKATQVLQKKGNKNVSTLHRLLYGFKPRSDGTFFKQAQFSILPYKIVVVDECSMAPKELLQQLFKHDVYIICLGDPGQLPPIRDEDDNHLLDNPHIFLDEVMRQAAESEIIQLSMKIRNGEDISLMKGNEVQIISKSELNTGMLQWADQILCATNNTRVVLNNQMRDLLG